MDMDYDQNLIARALLTIVTAIYGLGVMIADTNKTHVTNPLWTPHARFHCVWQILSYTGFALIAWALLWTPGPLYVARLYLVAAFAAVILVSFYAAFALIGLYGGSNYDVNGIQPKKVPLGLATLNLDPNSIVFSVATVLLVLAVWQINGAALS